MKIDNNNRGGDENRLDSLERLLRSQGPAELSAGFERSVMQQISALPLPRDSAPRNWRDLLYAIAMLSAAEKVAAVLILCGLGGLFVPGVSELLTVWSYELEATQLSMSIGESAFSASLLSIIVLGLAAAFLAGIGAYSTKNRLLGA